MLRPFPRALLLAAALLPGLARAIPEGPVHPSPEWAQREQANFARVLEAPQEQVQQPAFLQRWIEQSLGHFQSYVERAAGDPSWLLASSPLLPPLLAAGSADVAAGMQDAIARIQADPASALRVNLNGPLTPLCATWSLQCSGDPFVAPGVDPFFEQEAEVTPVVFYDRGCARISGRVWKPKHVARRLPGVVIQNGSVQAPETVYWWMAKALVRAGYVVMSFDPRGQGRSDWQTPDGEQGGNANPEVFWLGLVDAIDFFRSSPQRPYPHNASCAGTYPTPTTASNPVIDAIDPERLGIVGHSLGAIAVSVVQGYGAPGADPWPGRLDAQNPVKVAVAWDGLLPPGGGIHGGGAAGNLLEQLPAIIVDPLAQQFFQRDLPNFKPRVPSMGQSSEYGLTPTPFLQPPEPEAHKAAFEAWKAAGVPSYEFTIQGGTHYEWSLLATFPTTSWCPRVVNGECVGGWGNPMARHYTLAWLDRWLKLPGEPGYADADARLLDDVRWQERYSFYYRSARSFPDRNGKAQVCEDIRAGCGAGVRSGGRPSSGASSGGGALNLLALLGLALLLVRRRFRG